MARPPYTRISLDSQRRLLRVEKKTLSGILRDLRAARERLVTRLLEDSMTPAGSAEALTRLRAADRTAAEIEALLSRRVRTGADGALHLAATHLTKVLSAGGVEPLPLLRTVAIGPAAAAHSSRVAAMVRGVGLNVREDLRAILRQSVVGGRNINETVKEVGRAIPGRGAFGSVAARAEAIVRTELGRVYEGARDDGRTAIREAGIPMQKRWSSSLDGRTRVEHAALHGVTVPSEALFDMSGYACSYPGDERLPPHLGINCRCTVVDELAPR